MARAKQIIYNQGEGMNKIELVEPPQNFLTYLQIPLNFYGIFWFASVIVFTVNFFKKTTYKETLVLWPDKNRKRLKNAIFLTLIVNQKKLFIYWKSLIIFF